MKRVRASVVMCAKDWLKPPGKVCKGKLVGSKLVDCASVVSDVFDMTMY